MSYSQDFSSKIMKIEMKSTKSTKSVDHCFLCIHTMKHHLSHPFYFLGQCPVYAAIFQSELARNVACTRYIHKCI